MNPPREERNIVLIVMGIIFLLFSGIFFLVSQAMSAYSKVESEVYNIPVEATIVDYEYDSMHGYAPVYEWHLEGYTYQDSPNTYYKPKPNNIGSTIILYVNPADPSTFMDPDLRSGSITLMFTTIGFVFLTIAGVMLFIGVPKRPVQEDVWDGLPDPEQEPWKDSSSVDQDTWDV